MSERTAAIIASKSPSRALTLRRASEQQLEARVLRDALDAPSLAGALGDCAVAPGLVRDRGVRPPERAGDRPSALLSLGPALYGRPLGPPSGASRERSRPDSSEHVRVSPRKNTECSDGFAIQARAQLFRTLPALYRDIIAFLPRCRYHAVVAAAPCQTGVPASHAFGARPAHGDCQTPVRITPVGHKASTTTRKGTYLKVRKPKPHSM